ncbi:nucleotide-binding protein [Streptomyces sp. SPB162]|uniref:nucleotide-binding protein n=1 Tax=Streptomyces sp. SPB162 TaxID=2940560 RepID=UPI00240512AD|nr:nucleotide-binding protein [Streptomyces sp. SPB162]MDF9814137.1 putative nucleotide-binding protein [Streptomyces sp. SPB162]
MTDQVVEGGADPRKVFVIHGRNDLARRGLFEFLRAIGLDPIEWSEAIQMTGKGSPYIGEVLDTAFANAQAVVVLQTPDDVTYLHESLTYAGDPECSPQMQPRPNVLFEAGMAMGRDENRTVIVELGQVKTFSDIHGRHVVRLDNSVRKRQELATRLKTAGCATRLTGSDWHDAGDLTPPAPPGGGLPLGRKLPSSQASGMPRLDARYIDNGQSRLGEIQITNHGPGDVFDLDIDADANVGLVPRNEAEFPVPKLPAGKSVRVGRMSSDSLGSRSNSYFNITITYRTADGTPVELDEFVSGA